MAGDKRKSQRSKTNSVSSNQSEEHFNGSDRIVLNEINQTVKHLKEEMKVLKFELGQAKKEIVQVKQENERLKQAINLNIFANAILTSIIAVRTLGFMVFQRLAEKKMMVKTFYFKLPRNST